jgi:predicted esterase
MGDTSFRTPTTAGPWPALFSFHGYGEDAAYQHDRPAAHSERVRVAAGGRAGAASLLHKERAHRRQLDDTAGPRIWRIADNVRYVAGVVEAVSNEFGRQTSPIVFAGFSQGVAMAYRAAARIPAAGIIALAGDVPPDITQPLPEVLIGAARRTTGTPTEKAGGRRPAEGVGAQRRDVCLRGRTRVDRRLRRSRPRA